MTQQFNPKPPVRSPIRTVQGPPSWDQCRYGSMNSSSYENATPMVKRHRQDQPSGNRAEFLSGKHDDQARPFYARYEVANRVPPEEFCRLALGETCDQRFILLGNLCKSLAEKYSSFAEVRISPPRGLLFVRKNLIYLSLSGNDVFATLAPEDRHLVKSLHQHIKLILRDYR